MINKTEQEIINKWKTKEIIVSISCICYNQVQFIEKTLDSLLNQDTSFQFEVLIHDDASTDGTAEIIKSFEKKFPTIIKPIYEQENQWQKGRIGSMVFNFPRAKGKYFAICEGDDYWIDNNKLQKQIDFLETNKQFSISTHNAKLLDETGYVGVFNEKKLPKKLSMYKVINNWIIPTASMVFRREVIDFIPDIKSGRGDYLLQIAALDMGKCNYIDECMSVYRINNTKSASAEFRKDYISFYDTCKKEWKSIQSFFGHKYWLLFELMIIKMNILIDYHKSKNSSKSFYRFTKFLKHIIGKNEKRI